MYQLITHYEKYIIAEDQFIKETRDIKKKYDIDLFSFATYLGENFEYYDNTADGDIYLKKSNYKKYTQLEILTEFKNIKQCKKHLGI